LAFEKDEVISIASLSDLAEFVIDEKETPSSILKNTSPLKLMQSCGLPPLVWHGW